MSDVNSDAAQALVSISSSLPKKVEMRLVDDKSVKENVESVSTVDETAAENDRTVTAIDSLSQENSTSQNFAIDSSDETTALVSTAFNSNVCGENWSHHSGVELILQNITMTVDMGTRLDLQAIVLASRNCEYNPKRFAACIMRLRNPKCTALIFSSGKMIITGCKSYNSAIIGARSFVRIMNKVGFRKAEVNNPTPQNMVVTCDLGFPIRLEGLVCDHAQFATYEPELFPGLIYRLEHPKLVLIIFVSGKIVMTGGKALVSMQRAFEIMYPVLFEYRKLSALADLTRQIKAKQVENQRSQKAMSQSQSSSNPVIVISESDESENTVKTAKRKGKKRKKVVEHTGSNNESQLPLSNHDEEKPPRARLRSSRGGAVTSLPVSKSVSKRKKDNP